MTFQTHSLAWRGPCLEIRVITCDTNFQTNFVFSIRRQQRALWLPEIFAVTRQGPSWSVRTALAWQFQDLVAPKYRSSPEKRSQTQWMFGNSGRVFGDSCHFVWKFVSSARSNFDARVGVAFARVAVAFARVDVASQSHRISRQVRMISGFITSKRRYTGVQFGLQDVLPAVKGGYTAAALQCTLERHGARFRCIRLGSVSTGSQLLRQASVARTGDEWVPMTVPTWAGNFGGPRHLQGVLQGHENERIAVVRNSLG